MALRSRERTLRPAPIALQFTGGDQVKRTVTVIRLICQTARDVRPQARGMRCPRFASVSPSQQAEGAGKAGCALHPRSRVQWVVECAHEHTGSAEAFRPSLRNGFTAYIVLSPANRAFLPPSPPRSLLLENLTPASGCQDHTTLPSASATFVFRDLGVHRISPQRS